MLHLDFKIFLITSLRVTEHITIEIITECFNVPKISKSKEKLLYTKKSLILLSLYLPQLSENKFKTRLFLNRKQQLLKQVPLATFLKQSKIFYLQCEIKQLLNLSLKKND